MTWIVVGTTAAGMGTNAILFRLGMTELWLRTLLAVVPSYFVFLLLVRIWLGAFSGKRARERERAVRTLDGADVEDLEDVGDGIVIVRDVTSAASRHTTHVSSEGDWGWGDVDIDGEGVVLAVVFGILVLALALVGGYLVWEAPAILAETLFEFTLASAMAKRLGQSDRGDWLGHLVRRTWMPFVAVLVVTGIFAAAVATLRPNAERLPDLWRRPSVEALPSSS